MNLTTPTSQRPGFELFRGKDKKWYFRLRAKNGEIVAQSEAYESRQGCEKGIGATVVAVAESIEVQDHTFQVLVKDLTQN